MKIIDLTEEHKSSYFVCLEDWSDEMKEAGSIKEQWYDKMKEKGLRVKLAQDENGVIGGMIQYFPIEHSWVEGKDLYFIGCIWVHSYKKGRGDFRKQGMGKAMLKAAEDDAKELGAKGIVAWGLSIPVWMKASWFKKHGFIQVDRKGFLGEVLLWKKFTEDAVPPKWIEQKKKPEKVKGKVTVTCLVNGWCPAMNLSCERAKRAATEFGNKVELQEIDTFDKKTFNEWGVSDALYIDGKKVRTGPPPSYKKLKKRIRKRVYKLKT
ncbi:MAG: GNAT family N-acetyltransferase [Bacteroidales bacterium]|nr:GNAT family N-acetyltransferase [Bacteroidales bacterium]